MLLTIDIGNTNMVLGVFDGDTIVEHWRIATVPDRTADEIAVLLHGLLARSTVVKEQDLAGISLCSTVPSALHEMREMVRRYYPDLPAVIVQPGVKTGLPIRMDNPKEVGSDRIMNSLAAVHLYGGPAIVVDFGTSTNFDAVSAKGEFVGGALAPGIEISVDALSRRAAQLLKVELTRPPRVVGKNTVEALQSGIVYGFAGQVEGIARRMAAELSPEDPGAVTVIATGGLASLVIDEVPIIDAHEPWLTLIGLRLVWGRNTVVSRGDDPPDPGGLRARWQKDDTISGAQPGHASRGDDPPGSGQAGLTAKPAIVSGPPARTAFQEEDPEGRNRHRPGPAPTGEVRGDSAVTRGDGSS